MSDPFYSPTHLPPERRPRRGDVIWTETRDQVTWTCELRDHDAAGVEAQVLQDGDLVVGRRFGSRNQAHAWADLFRERLRT
jgi:hypothetical protein